MDLSLALVGLPLVLGGGVYSWAKYQTQYWKEKEDFLTQKIREKPGFADCKILYSVDRTKAIGISPDATDKQSADKYKIIWLEPDEDGPSDYRSTRIKPIELKEVWHFPGHIKCETTQTGNYYVTKDYINRYSFEIKFTQGGMSKRRSLFLLNIPVVLDGVEVDSQAYTGIRDSAFKFHDMIQDIIDAHEVKEEKTVKIDNRYNSGNLTVGSGNSGSQVQGSQNSNVTKNNVYKAFIEIENILKQGLSEETKAETTPYIAAAKEEVQSSTPDKKLIKPNIELFVRVLQKTAEGTEALQKMKPFLKEVSAWLQTNFF
jgi:hypothetical protein